VLLSAWFPGCTEDSTQEAEGDVLVPVRGLFVVRVHAGEEGSMAEREFPFPDGDPGDDPLRVQWLPAPRVRGVFVDGG